jgi:hypothetical protein
MISCHDVIAFEAPLRAGLRARLREFTPEQGYLHSSSVKTLACEIADMLLQFNYSCRDILKEWESLIDLGMKDLPLRLHTSHLYALAKTVDLYLRTMSPLKDALEALCRPVSREVGADTFSIYINKEFVTMQAAFGTSSITRQQTMQSFAPLRRLTSTIIPFPLMPAMAEPVSEVAFFKDERMAIMEMYDDLSGIYADCDGIKVC